MENIILFGIGGHAYGEVGSIESDVKNSIYDSIDIKERGGNV